jgi:UDP-N-acetylglucosamine 2-epimerase (non-hydrolysing)
MDKIKVCSVFGTRPEAIKMAPVVLELQRRTQEFEHVLVVTGQHRTMLDQMLTLFELKPDHDLDIMQARQTLTHVTTNTLIRIEDVYKHEKPDIVLVHGDTSTSFVSGLAAYYQQIPVAHVEAGLRTGDKYNPFPEEMNRKLIDGLADLLFAPTRAAADSLIAENADANAIYITGNTVIDALLAVAGRPEPPDLLPDLPPDARIILVEAHRRENLGQPMEQICHALLDLAQRPDVHIVFPVHLNPAVRDTVMPMLQGHERISLLEPCDYLPFVFLMKKATLILTDSGGIQEEGPSLKSPVLVLRKATERPEAIEARTALLVGPDRHAIVSNATRLLDDPSAYAEMTGAMNPYGDGRAAMRIADALLHFFGRQASRPVDYSPGS